MKNDEKNNIFYSKEWNLQSVKNSCEKISLNKIKIKQKDYLSEGKYPVIDQGQELIGGYSNKDDMVVPGEPPFIIFGDHTKVIKFINFKFIAGADGVKVLKPKDILIPKLFYYFLHSIKFEDRGYSRHYQFLEKKYIPIPPRPIQENIVGKIEELLSELDNGVKELKNVREQLKIYRQSVLSAAFSGKLTNRNLKNGELPKERKEVKLGEVINNVEYGSAKKSKKKGKIPVLRMGNIQNGKFNWTDLVYTSDENEIKKYLLKKNDVLFNRTNSPELVGKTAIYNGERPAIFAGYLIRINIIENLILPNFLNYYLNSIAAKNYGNSVKSFGVNQSNINGTKLKSYPIFLPTINEQQKIVEEIETRLSICDKMEEAIDNSLAQSESLRQSILKQAFEGKLTKF